MIRKILSLFFCVLFVGMFFAGCAGGSDDSEITEALSADSQALPPSENQNEEHKPESLDFFAGVWKVGGLYSDGQIVLISEVKKIAEAYASASIVFDGMGHFSYFSLDAIENGEYSAYDGGDGDSFLLKTNLRSVKNGNNGDVDEQKVYLASFADSKKSFFFAVFDPVYGKALAGETPLFFVRESDSLLKTAGSETTRESKSETETTRKEQPTSVAQPRTETPRSTEPSGSSGIGNINAVNEAKAYLDFKAFSYKGLIEQLEFEGYSHSEAVFGADHCGADWYEQAALSAQEYLDFSSFSRNELYEQLLYEGFTESEAEYGVDTAYQ